MRIEDLSIYTVRFSDNFKWRRFKRGALNKVEGKEISDLGVERARKKEGHPHSCKLLLYDVKEKKRRPI